LRRPDNSSKKARTERLTDASDLTRSAAVLAVEDAAILDSTVDNVEGMNKLLKEWS